MSPRVKYTRNDAVIASLVAHLERDYGRARLLRGRERRRVAATLGVWHRCEVIDCGGGLLATVGPHGGGLQMHDLGGDV